MIFVIYRPRFCPFVHFVIVLYCIYAFWVVITRRIKLRSTISTVGGARAWAVLLAKTSRTAVPTAIMPIIAGDRLYKCLYKMHVDSRAFWGAFGGAFQVFLSEPGWGETRWPPRPLGIPGYCAIVSFALATKKLKNSKWLSSCGLLWIYDPFLLSWSSSTKAKVALTTPLELY